MPSSDVAQSNLAATRFDREAILSLPQVHRLLSTIRPAECCPALVTLKRYSGVPELASARVEHSKGKPKFKIGPLVDYLDRVWYPARIKPNSPSLTTSPQDLLDKTGPELESNQPSTSSQLPSEAFRTDSQLAEQLMQVIAEQNAVIQSLRASMEALRDEFSSLKPLVSRLDGACLELNETRRFLMNRFDSEVSAYKLRAEEAEARSGVPRGRGGASGDAVIEQARIARVLSSVESLLLRVQSS